MAPWPKGKSFSAEHLAKLVVAKAGQMLSAEAHAAIVAASTTHGLSKSATYMSWGGMIQRTTNPRHQDWARYGGRGITVCDRWRAFENFLADMGERPAGLTLDRKNNDGNYEPDNCQWATKQEQTNNRRPYPVRRARVRRLSHGLE